MIGNQSILDFEKEAGRFTNGGFQSCQQKQKIRKTAVVC